MTPYQLVPDALDPAACRALIASSEARGYAPAGADYPPGYRTNDRQVLDDPALAARLLERLRPHLPARLVAGGAVWELEGLNERLRSCRYLPGQWFGRHRDGVHHRGPGVQSHLTFMIYLDEPPAFAGGATRFFAGRERDAAVVAQVVPRAGALILFDHAAWHDGAPVTAGCKHILRSDVLYRRLDGPDAGDGHLGYVWTLAELPDGRVASGGRDRTIRIWRDGAQERCWEAHEGSVLAVRAHPEGLVSAGRDRAVKLWTADGRGHVLRRHDAAALCLEVLADGSVASGSADGTLAVGERRLEHGGWVRAVAAWEGSLITACEDGVLRVWRDGRCDSVGLGAPLWSLAVGPRGIAAGDANGVVHVLGVGSFAAHAQGVTSLAWMGERLVTGSEDDAVALWDVAGRGGPVGGHGDFVRAVCPLRDGRIATAGYDGRVVLRAVP